MRIQNTDGLEGLNRTMQYGNDVVSPGEYRPRTLFKSYYVVWKQKKKKAIIDMGLSLNRTMQYGNFQTAAQKALQNSV